MGKPTGSAIGSRATGYTIKRYELNLGIEHLTYNASLKPHFKNKEVFFNISHTDGIVVCTVTDVNEIGIDIEKLSNIDIHPFKDMLTKDEWKFVNNSANPSHSFIALWTKKEAIIKASGYGFSAPLNSFKIGIDNKSEIKNKPYSIKEIFIDERYRCHLAIKGDLLQIAGATLFIEHFF